MTNIDEVIYKLKEVKKEKNLSLNNIVSIMEEKGVYPVSKSSLSRVFSDDSEDRSFDYEKTIRPIAIALLDIETIEPDDNMDIQALKTLLKYKIERIEELEASLAKEKLKYHEKLDEERERHQKSIDFLKTQIERKDQRIDYLLEAVHEKDSHHKELLELILSCPARKNKTECG